MKKLLASLLTLIVSFAFAANVLADATSTAVPDVTVTPPSAGSVMGRLRNIASGPGGFYNSETNEHSALQYASLIIGVFLGMLGVIFLYLIIYAGYLWMTAQGDKVKVTKAGDIMRAAILGILIVAGAYAIWMYIFGRLVAVNGLGSIY